MVTLSLCVVVDSGGAVRSDSQTNSGRSLPAVSARGRHTADGVAADVHADDHVRVRRCRPSVLSYLRSHKAGGRCLTLTPRRLRVSRNFHVVPDGTVCVADVQTSGRGACLASECLATAPFTCPVSSTQGAEATAGHRRRGASCSRSSHGTNHAPKSHAMGGQCLT